jgi:hypothetical protein
MDLPEIKRATTAAIEMNRLARIGKILEWKEREKWVEESSSHIYFFPTLSLYHQLE